ncbi:MAG: class I SAM-dependent methyltransferase [Chitinispirillaceae bacterium]
MIEYVFMRLVRRMIPERVLKRIQFLIPYYSSSLGEINSSAIVEEYMQYCSSVKGKCVLELGCGATNGTGYGFVLKGVRKWWGYEPFQKFYRRLDNTQRELLESKYHKSVEQNAVERIQTMEKIPKNSVDLIVSNSVLEHVANCEELFSRCSNVLKPGGKMVHKIDYRDHFFKYPFHFLTFSKALWDRYLNPGDLHRYRISDHLESMENAKFKARCLTRKCDREKYELVRTKIHEDFKKYSEDDLMTTMAIIEARLQ